MFYRFELVKYPQIRRLKLEKSIEEREEEYHKTMERIFIQDSFSRPAFRRTDKWPLNGGWPLNRGLS